MPNQLRRCLAATLLVVALLLGAAPVLAADYDYVTHTPPLSERVTPEVLSAVFPDADRVEPLDDNGPPALAAYKAKELVGYVFSTLDVVRAHGYSGTPFDVIAGVDLNGEVTGAVSLFHREPLIMEDGLRTQLMQQFLLDTKGMSSRLGAVDGPKPEFIAGATTSGRAFRNAIRDSALLVLNARIPQPVITEPTLDLQTFRKVAPADLLADGSIATVTISNADVGRALDQAELHDATLEVTPKGEPGDLYMQLRAGLATPATIGRNAASRGAHDRLLSEWPQGTNAIFVASSGQYDFLGSGFQKKESGFQLDRLQIIQGDHVFTFDRDHFTRAGYGLGKVSGLVFLPPDSGFDPLQPWRAQVLAYATDAAGNRSSVALPPLDYVLPAQYVLLPPAPQLPAWMEAWQASWLNVAILGAALVLLTVILATQSWWTRRRHLHRWVRTSFLAFTLVWLGWTVGGQLSIVHLINYIKAPWANLDFGFYLAEPLIVMISIYTAVALVLLGRGVFCGWLCPFGALQELLAQAARALKLPQWNPSETLQRKLWWGKYASFGIVVGLMIFMPSVGSAAEEVEPFKTAISAHFLRAWPLVVYAVALLGIGLFSERAYCRFLCPLGGALAILDRLHLLNLLKRRPECGNPCHLCERSCPVKAIEKSGKIVMAECFQCLDCQVEYYDDHRCPPLAKQRKQRERVAANNAGPRVPIRIAARAAGSGA